MRSPEDLEALPDAGVTDGAIALPRSVVERFSGPALAVPEVRSVLDLQIVSSIACSVPALGDAGGWNVRFGRELNATDDRRHFTEGSTGFPVVEGKHIAPFTVGLDAVRSRLPARVADSLLDPERTYRRARLAYRDVASATNRLTLIAAIVPAGAVTTHTLFCLRDEASDDIQHFLCGIFNSYVGNYLVRLRVTTHVGAAAIDRLPVPRPSVLSRVFKEVACHSRTLSRDPTDRHSATELQATCAQLYGLDARSFAHVLSTFPLVEASLRDAALARFAEL
jgi:hypothetical protein